MLQISALVQDESTGQPIAAQVFTSDANGNTIDEEHYIRAVTLAGGRLQHPHET